MLTADLILSRPDVVIAICICCQDNILKVMLHVLMIVQICSRLLFLHHEAEPCFFNPVISFVSDGFDTYVVR